MRKEREELRRGVRELIEDASREMGAIAEEAQRGQTDPAAEARPILRLVRDPLPEPARSDPVPAPAATEPAPPEDVPLLLPKKGVCAVYFRNKHCWEVPDAFCNTALQVCMMRECPIFALHKEEMEDRFAGKFRHFW